MEKVLPKLYKDTKLAPLDLKFNTVREETYTVTLDKAHRSALKGQVAQSSRNAKASVLFVVRRPGCILCHEQGHDLSKLIEEFPAQSVAAFAAVKETNVDNEGLLQLYNHFRFPFYRDTDRQLYKALGDRFFNPARILLFPFHQKRWEKKGLRGSFFEKKGSGGSALGKGDPVILGGIMVFNRKGEVQYVYKEKAAEELPVDEIRSAILEVMNE